MSPDPLTGHKRRAGVLIPLSSLRSRNDCGIGDAGALPAFFDWMNAAGLSVLQVLPLNDLAPLDSCPYSAISAFALDIAYIDLAEVPEIRRSPGLQAEIHAARETGPLARARADRRTRFPEARAFKLRMLEAAFSIFEGLPEGTDPARTQDFSRFVSLNSGWLDDYALFRVLKEWSGWQSWTSWPEGLRTRSPEALEPVRRHHARRLRFFQYLQWLAFAQWHAARKLARDRGILLYGDIPFGLNLESADVWAHQEDFDFSSMMGAPPDQFSSNGQSWGLPSYRWDRMHQEGLRWWRRRIRQAAELYDLFRLDHAVGFFRTWRISKEGPERGFDVADEGRQRSRGEAFFRMVLEEAGSSRPIAEDLGVIPPFAREVLSALEIPGYKVTRWEGRGDGYWHPRDFPRVSVATSGTHDTSTLASWWREMSAHERGRYWEMVTAKREEPPPFSGFVHERLLENILSAHSEMAILPFQDIVGSRRRINVPGTVEPSNWTYRIPWSVEDFFSSPRVAAKTGMLRRLAEASGRASAQVETPGKTC